MDDLHGPRPGNHFSTAPNMHVTAVRTRFTAGLRTRVRDEITVLPFATHCAEFSAGERGKRALVTLVRNV